MRQILLFTLFIGLSSVVSGQWTTDPQVNAQLTPLDGQDRHRQVLAAPDKGWYILYDHKKDNDEDVWLALVDSVGNIIWDKFVYNNTEGGTRGSEMVPDDSGGVIVMWTDNRLETSSNVYLQRVNQNGDLLWGANDVIVGVSEGTEFCPTIISDQQGGAIIGLFDDDPPEQELKGLYVYRISASGQRLWRTLIVGTGSFSCSGGENSQTYDLCTDNAGGAYIFHTGLDPVAPLENKLRGMHLSASGSKLWPDETVTVGPVSWPVGMTIHATQHGTSKPRAVPNNDGTVYVLWDDDPGLFDPNIPEHIRGQHLNSEGDESWSEGGLMLNTDHESSLTVHALSDTSYNIYFTFHDGENFKLQKILPDGSQPWGNGVAFRNETTEVVRSLVLTSCQDIIIGYNFSPSPVDEPNIYATRIDPNGQFVWNPNALRLSSTLKNQVDARIAINDHDELIAVWLDQSTAGTSTDFNIYMQGFYKSGELSGIVTSVFAPMVHPLSIAPNPANDYVLISLGEFTDGGTLVLTDALGRLIKKEVVSPGRSEISINLENLPAGFYMINVFHENYKLAAKLVVRG